jgi:type VI secretion system ImpM family protein
MIRSSTSLELAGFGCFGKLPLSREFIVEGSKSLADSGFERWIGEGVGLAKARLGSRFDGLISTFPRYRFFWQRGKDLLLAGVITPSEDAAGRKHPFALFAGLHGKQPSALTTALQVCSLQEQTATRLDSIYDAETPEALRDTIRATGQDITPPETSAQDRYQHFLTEQSGETFWRDLAGPENNDGRFTVFQALVETLPPPGKDKSRGFRGGIRYPLSHGNSSDTALESCFWLDLTEQCLGHTLESNWWFRSPCGAGEDNRYFHLFLSPPIGNQWMSLIDPGSDLETISYLDRPYGTEPPEQRMDPDLRAILESKTATFGDYLSWASGF